MKHPLIIGHRGASAVAPENTMAAFRSALTAGADGVEFDVRLCQDQIPVVIHDETLRRTAGLPGRIADLHSDVLKKTDVGSWFANDFATETVPTLLQLFELFAPSSAVLYLEMKCDSTGRNRLAEVCCALLNQSSLKERVVVECFDLLAIAQVKQIDANIRTAALFEPSIATPPLIASRRIIDSARAVGADEIALHHKLASARTIEKAKDQGFKVVLWTVDDPKWIERGRSMGVDALITNNPTVMLAHREKRSGV